MAAVQVKTKQPAGDPTYPLLVSESTRQILELTLNVYKGVSQGKGGIWLTDYFYRRMLSSEPSLRNVFNQANQSGFKQPMKLYDSFLIAAECAIAKKPYPADKIDTISQRHVGLMVTPAMYAIVKTHLVQTIIETLEAGGDQRVYAAWAELYDVFAAHLMTLEKKLYEDNKNAGWKVDTGDNMANNGENNKAKDQKRLFQLVKKEKLSPLVTQYFFSPQDGKPLLAVKPGKYLTLWMQVGSYTQPRHYTIVPTKEEVEDSCYSICVKRDGAVSTGLELVGLRECLPLSPPQGAFNLQKYLRACQRAINYDTSTGSGGPYLLLLSAGTGITAMLSLLARTEFPQFASGKKLKIAWCHGCRNGQEQLFRDKVADIIQKKTEENETLEIQQYVWYSRPRDDDPTTDGKLVTVKTGHMDLQSCAELSRFLGGRTTAAIGGTYAYMCGPGGWLSKQRQDLTAMSKRICLPENVVYESYGEELTGEADPMMQAALQSNQPGNDGREFPLQIQTQAGPLDFCLAGIQKFLACK